MKIKKNTLYVFVFGVFLYGVFFTGMLPKRNVPFDGDELATIYYIDAFKHAFLDRNFSENVWDTKWVYDQPQLSKYLFGFVLTLNKSNGFSTIDTFKSTYGVSWKYQMIEESELKLSEVWDIVLLFRAVNIVWLCFFFLSFQVLVVYVTGSVLLSFVSVLLLMNSQTFFTPLLQARSDVHYLTLGSVSLLFFLQFVRDKKRWVFFLSQIFGAFAMNSKLPAVYLFVAYVAFLLLARFTKTVWKNQIQNAVVMVLVWCVVWVVVNPPLWYAPLHNSYEFILRRLAVIRMQETAFPGLVMTSVWQRLRNLLCMTMNGGCTNGTSLAATPLFVINSSAFLYGVYVVVNNTLKKNAISAVVLLTFISSLCITAVPIYFPWARYYIPVYIHAFLIQLIGISFFYSTYVYRKKIKKN